MQTFGISAEDAKDMSSAAAEMKKDTGRFKEILQSNKKKLENGKLNSPNLVMMASRNEFLLEKFIERSAEAENQKEEILTRIPNYSKLSSEGQNIYNKEAEVKTLKKFKG